METLHAILTAMVAAGQAEWLTIDGIKKGIPVTTTLKCLLYWRKPGEWADLIYNHIMNTGQRDQVITIYELIHSEEASNTPFYQLPESMWRRALHILERQKRAKLFDSESVTNSLELGVRFF